VGNNNKTTLMNKIDVVDYFNKPRYLVISAYPEPAKLPWHDLNEVVGSKNKDIADFYLTYPSIFKPLAWYEGRTISELLMIRFIEIVKPSYYVAGDKVKITSFKFDGLETLTPAIIGFHIGGTYKDGKHSGGHTFKLDECKPASEAKLV
jgi:hypothetical protein